MTRLVPRLKINRNGTATLSGIPAGYLRSIFTAASIHHYDTERKHKAKEAEVQTDAAEHSHLADAIMANYADEDLWMRTMRMLIDSIADSPKYRHGYEDVPVIQLDQMGRFCRLRAVRQSRKSRVWVDDFMERLFPKSKEASHGVA